MARIWQEFLRLIVVKPKTNNGNFLYAKRFKKKYEEQGFYGPSVKYTLLFMNMKLASHCMSKVKAM